MKKVLGLDIGVNSVGYALVDIADTPGNSRILKSGVRIINEDPNFHGKFYTGNSASKNADRRTKRTIRRLNNRYKNRRDELIGVLEQYDMMPDDDLLYRASALELYELRNAATKQQVSLKELGRILYHLNQKRGFASNRKSQSDEENSSEYLSRIRNLEEQVKDTTIGSFFYKKLQTDPFFKIKENIFPRKAYIHEFDTIWQQQKKYYPDVLSGGINEKNKGTLYQVIRNEIIYYQRPLKSQKHLVANCRFEPLKKVAPKSSPLYQVFRIWQQLNNLIARSSDGSVRIPTIEDKAEIFNALHNPKKLDAKGLFAKSKILKILQVSRYSLNYEQFEGNKTYLTLYNALNAAGINDPERYLFFNPFVEDEKGGLWQLWHITYSLNTEQEVISALMKHFGFSREQSTIIAAKTGYTADFGNVSAKAIRKLLPHLAEGKHYDKACNEAGYQHTDLSIYDEDRQLSDQLEAILPNTLRNPVVEQILNQVVNVVNAVITNYGKPDEIRVELARELKSNAKQRKKMTFDNKKLRTRNEDIRKRLLTEYGFKRVNARDLLRYRLWEETEQLCLYSGKPIQFTDLYNGTAEIEHIIPKSRSFSNSASNYIIAFNNENTLKGQRTAYDYIQSKGEDFTKAYIDRINRLHDEGKITIAKRNNLLCAGDDISSDFLERQLKDTQYICRTAVEMLRKTVKKVTTTTGSITDYLRNHWQLSHVLKEVNLAKYRELGKTEWQIRKDNTGNDQQFENIVNWTKRDDHRHHAVDAIIVALTNQSIIQRLNNLNKEYETYKELKQSAYDFPLPIANLRTVVKEQLENTIISFKKPNTRVLSRKINIIKVAGGEKKQVTWAPRGSLHEDTIMAQKKWYKKLPLDKKFNDVEHIVSEPLKTVLIQRLSEYNYDPKKAFNNLQNNPVLFNGVPVTEVVVWESFFVKRVRIDDTITQAQLNKIVDKRTKDLLLERVKTSGTAKAAFKDYDNNPILINADKNIPIRNITVFDDGNLSKVREGFVYTKGNHHAIIYSDGNGNFSDKVVSFWEAVEQCLLNIKDTGTIYPIINKQPNEKGWKFYYSLQINDLVVFDLNPKEIDFFDPNNRALLTQHTFRVQALSKGDYWFRHQYETTRENDHPFAMRRVRSAQSFKNITKIRVNHLGEIIKVENT